MNGSIDYLPNLGKTRRERDFLTMRGLLMALFAFDFPGHDGNLRANHWAGSVGASVRSAKTTAKTSAKTTAKTV